VAENEKSSPWANVGWGLLLIAIGVGSYFWFANMEQEGGSIRTHVVIILVYKTLGKNGVLGLFGLIGLVLVALGLKGIASGE
jgi:hypothetical protein